MSLTQMSALSAAAEAACLVLLVDETVRNAKSSVRNRACTDLDM